MKQTEQHVRAYEELSTRVKTFHHHVSILRDIADSIDKDTINYLEIGCFAGGTACFMQQDPRVRVVSVDLGWPINPSVVSDNVESVIGNLDRFTYIQGNSQLSSTVQQVSDLLSEVDILFIDGDHSRKGVFADFNNYSPFVVNGGYIVFDDYLDFTHSPDVYAAVNDIVSDLKGYEVIGSVENTFNAKPSSTKDERFSHLNEFILRKNG